MRRKTKHLALSVGSAALLASWLTSPEPDRLQTEVELVLAQSVVPTTESSIARLLATTTTTTSTAPTTSTTTEVPFPTSTGAIPLGPNNDTYCHFPEEGPADCYATLEEALAVTTTTGPLVPSTTTTRPKPAQLADPNITHRLYRMYEKSNDTVHLQMMLGLSSVDGIYGPITRKAHMEYLGGPEAAVHIFYPEFGYRLPHAPGKTLGELIDIYFSPQDRSWARQVAFCESSGQTHHTQSTVVSSALAIGWFQHLAKYWIERSEAAGWVDADPFDPEANVAVAAWLFYTSGEHHWNPSRACWGAP